MIQITIAVICLALGIATSFTGIAISTYLWVLGIGFLVGLLLLSHQPLAYILGSDE